LLLLWLPVAAVVAGIAALNDQLRLLQLIYLPLHLHAMPVLSS
jgi:hypothetical protein